MKIAKKTREDAATILSAYACASEDADSPTCEEIHESLGFPYGSRARQITDLVYSAFFKLHRGPHDDWRATYAEAEAVLRTGWEP